MFHDHLFWTFLVNPAGVDTIPPGYSVVSSGYTVTTDLLWSGRSFRGAWLIGVDDREMLPNWEIVANLTRFGSHPFIAFAQPDTNRAALFVLHVSRWIASPDEPHCNNQLDGESCHRRA